jgi:hypothetical protein
MRSDRGFDAGQGFDEVLGKLRMSHAMKPEPNGILNKLNFRASNRLRRVREKKMKTDAGEELAYVAR